MIAGSAKFVNPKMVPLAVSIMRRDVGVTVVDAVKIREYAKTLVVAATRHQ